MSTMSIIDFLNDEEFQNLKLKIGERISHDKSLKLSVSSIICNSSLVELLRENIERYEEF